MRAADDQTFHDEIEGYCGRLSYRPGEVATLHVATRRPLAFDVVVERWGAAREVVWRTQGVPGRLHHLPRDADARGCRWPVAAEIPIGDDWRSGFHLVTLVAPDAAPGRDVAHACFVVRPPRESTERMLLVLGTNTWHAYNTWGGRSLYTGGDTVSFARPFARGMLDRPEVDRDDRKARPTRYGEEPDADGTIFQAYRTEHAYPSAIGSTGWFTHERRFVEWAEAAGYRFDYAVSADVHDHPDLLDRYDLVLSVGHDEYWSAGQRAAVEAFIRGGGNFASFSGNTMFWQVRLDESDDGIAMICHKYAAHETDPVVAAGRPELMTGMWADPLVGRPEWTVLGAGSAFGLYHRFGAAAARGVGGFVVYRHAHWLLAGTELRYGDVLGGDDGVVGYETVGCPITFDEFQLPVVADREGMAPFPADTEVVAFTPSSNLGVGDYPSSIAALSDQGDLEFIATRLYGSDSEENRIRVRNGNAAMVTCRPFGEEGGEVVTVGSTDWVFGLRADPRVARVTANVLDRSLH